MTAHDPSTSPLRSAENRLARETSPYLLQHKHNPVAWWPWGPDALAEAQRHDKPILLSVGYAACHWCHVMAHESFEDDATAAVMNDLFVNIKVDREERPDIDQIYMSALHHLGEQGGWPLTMFLTPKGEPVWGGTYFPKTSRFGRPAFVDVLREVSRLFREERHKIDQNRDALMERLESRARPAGKVVIGAKELDQLAMQIGGAFDQQHGGLRGAPKFPNAALYELVWRAGDADRRRAVLQADRAHARAHLRRRHLRPPRRRLLALLGRRAMAGAALREDALRQRPASGASGAGACPHRASALPAAGGGDGRLARPRDDDARKGRSRPRSTPIPRAKRASSTSGRWPRSEQALGPDDAAVFVQHYDVTAEGNFEGHNILNLLNHLPRSRKIEARLAMLRDKLFMLREKRVRPGLDDKVLADWNGDDDRGACQCRLDAGRAGLDRAGGTGLRFHCANR